ncbi:MAG: serine/threonine-protein kinase [Thermoguttaceae bacterium]
MSGPHQSAFERAALASRLLTPEQLDEARSLVLGAEPGAQVPAGRSFDQRLADKLVETGRLNVWQAKQLLEGRSKFNLGPYWIIDYLGRGGMGQVFKARHEVLGRIVAVKVLPRSRSTPEDIANFTREIHAQARLDHPNLVRALDAGRDGNVYFLVTEYVPGTDLRKWVRKSGPMNMFDAASIISQVAAGLHSAHQQGLVHRDVKPGNVLVTPDGRAKLSDLGLAGPFRGGAEADFRFGRIVGTADYLSPDQIQSPWNPTPAWDIYSLGCTLYYAVTGKVPFPGGTTADKIRGHLELRPLDPRRLNPRLSDPFVELMADMMAKNPAERIRSAAEVIQRLAPWAGASLAVSGPGGRARFVPPVIAVPPGVEVPAASTCSAAADLIGLDEGDSTFPDIPQLPAAQPDHSSQLSQTTHPSASAADETPSQVDDQGQDSPVRGAWFSPLGPLVVFPLIVVGFIVVVWWVAGLLQFGGP